jgi:tetratricopeptide (TPR) repeat protein
VARVRRPVLAGTAIVALLFAARSAQRATVWRDNGVFFLQLIQDAPTSYRSHWAMGSYAFSHGDSVLGERELMAAIRLNPDQSRLLEQLGRIYAASGRYEPAIPILERAVALDSTRMPAALTLSLALARTGRVEKGLEVLETAAEIHGEVGGVLVTRGEILKRAGQPLAALAALEDMIARAPDLWRLRVMAAEALALAGQCEAALRRLEELPADIPESGRADVTALAAWVANGNAPCK